MRKTLYYLTIALTALFSFSALTASAARKNEPDDPEEILEELGGDHWDEDMKVYDVGPVKVENKETDEETYYHVYYTMTDDRYRLLFFDNTPTYLGYYEINQEPTGYEEGAVMIGTGNRDYIRFGVEGPPESITIDGVSSKFIKNKEAEKKKAAEEAAAAGKSGNSSGVEAEYREWTLNISGRELSFNAIFVKREGTKVYLKEAKRGITKPFELSKLSREDIEYLKSLGDI